MTDREYIENKVRHAFNKGYDIGFKDGKEKAKSQEPILDKIRAEIKDASHGKWYVGRLDGKSEEVLLMDEVLEIIDKYKAESEE